MSNRSIRLVTDHSKDINDADTVLSVKSRNSAHMYKNSDKHSVRFLENTENLSKNSSKKHVKLPLALRQQSLREKFIKSNTIKKHGNKNYNQNIYKSIIMQSTRKNMTSMP